MMGNPVAGEDVPQEEANKIKVRVLMMIVIGVIIVAVILDVLTRVLIIVKEAARRRAYRKFETICNTLFAEKRKRNLTIAPSCDRYHRK